VARQQLFNLLRRHPKAVPQALDVVRLLCRFNRPKQVVEDRQEITKEINLAIPLGIVKLATRPLPKVLELGGEPEDPVLKLADLIGGYLVAPVGGDGLDSGCIPAGAAVHRPLVVMIRLHHACSLSSVW
jgi:hypothetical protein